MVNAVVVEEEAISAIERIEPEGKWKEAFGCVKERHGQLGAPALERSFPAVKRSELAPLDIQFNEVDPLDLVRFDQTVDRTRRKTLLEPSPEIDAGGDRMRCVTRTVDVRQADVEELNVGCELRIHLKRLSHDLAVSEHRIEGIDAAMDADVRGESEGGVAETAAAVDYVIPWLGSDPCSVPIEVVLPTQERGSDVGSPALDPDLGAFIWNGENRQRTEHAHVPRIVDLPIGRHGTPARFRREPDVEVAEQPVQDQLIEQVARNLIREQPPGGMEGIGVFDQEPQVLGVALVEERAPVLCRIPVSVEVVLLLVVHQSEHLAEDRRQPAFRRFGFFLPHGRLLEPGRQARRYMATS